MGTNYNHNRAFKIVRRDLANPNAVERVATQLRAILKLGRDPVFLAWCELHVIGAENECDEIRATALELMQQWVNAVLAPACSVRAFYNQQFAERAKNTP